MNITEYTKKYAEATALMWNESRDHFGGGDEIETAEDRDKKEKHSGNIVTMLALEDEKVIGYCGLSEYKEDTGALYIPLLNAHPSYLGKGVGKALVLEAIKRTVKTGWPRLDLYTWPGNTKAVPLYKRCGFFWEDRDDYTHLMNFIPLVLQHPLLKTVINEDNWYRSLKQDLTIAPNREKMNDFSVFTYLFDILNQHIEIGIEHSSRQIYKIETSDFTAEWLLPAKVLNTGVQYEATLTITNKTTNPLQIEAIGAAKEPFGFKYEINEMIEQEAEFTFPFSIDHELVIHEQSEWKSHPFCAIPLKVNQVSCPLACGYAIKEPLKLEAYVQKPALIEEKGKGELVIQVTNQQKQTVEATLTLLENDYLELHQATETLTVNEKRTNTLSMPFSLKKMGVGKLKILVEAGSSSSYQTTIPLVIPSDKTLGFYEQNKKLIVVNGKDELLFNRDSFKVHAKSNKRHVPWTLYYPSFNEPLSNELATVGWNHLSCKVEENALLIHSTFPLQGGSALLTIDYRWHRNKSLEVEMYIRNQTNDSIDLHSINVPVYFFPDQVFLPTEKGILHVNQVNLLEINELPLHKLNEQWILLKWKEGTLGLTADENGRFVELDDEVCLRWNVNPLQSQSTSEKMEFVLYPNMFQEPQAFAQQLSCDNRIISSEFAFFKNSGFVQNEEVAAIDIQTGKKERDEGHVLIEDESRSSYPFSQTNGEINIAHPVTIDSPTKPIQIHYKGEHYEKKRLLQAVRKKDEEVVSTIEEIEGHQVHTVANGELVFRASETYYPSVYSVQTKREWLDHLYPEAGPKSWWNPWGGGIMTIPKNLQLLTIMEQSHTVSFVKMSDQWNQQWHGIKISIKFNEHRDYAGAILNQYYVTLTGATVLAHLVECEQGPTLLTDKHWLSGSFLNRESLSIYPTASEDELFHLRGGQFDLHGHDLDSINRLYASDTEETLVVISQNLVESREFFQNKDVFAYMNLEKLEKWPDQERVQSQPQFFVWTEGLPSSQGWEWIRDVQLKEDTID